jgi:uroporphyrinogen-III synthase
MISIWTAYEAIAAERLSSIAADALREGRLDAALHYSRRSASILLDLAGAVGVKDELIALAHLCLSTDTAVPFRDAGAGRVTIAERPHEDALLDALDGRGPT